MLGLVASSTTKKMHAKQFCVSTWIDENLQLSKTWFSRSGRGYESLNDGTETSARTRSLIHYKENAYDIVLCLQLD